MKICHKSKNLSKNKNCIKGITPNQCIFRLKTNIKLRFKYNALSMLVISLLPVKPGWGGGGDGYSLYSGLSVILTFFITV